MHVWCARTSEGLGSMKTNQEWKHDILIWPVKPTNRYTKICDESPRICESEDYFVRDVLYYLKGPIDRGQKSCFPGSDIADLL